jgi:hypothetical protein
MGENVIKQQRNLLDMPKITDNVRKSLNQMAQKSA